MIGSSRDNRVTQRRLALAAALALAIAAVVASWPAPETPVAQSAGLLLPAAAPPVAALGPPPPIAAPLPTPPPGDLTGLTLAGVFGRAAVFEDNSGRQRLARVGAPVAPGVRLASVGRTSATVESGGQFYRLDLRGGAARPVASQPPPAASPIPAASGDAARYRLAFAPEREGTRIVGFRLREGPVPPVLARAGLQPGDVVTMINGQAFQSVEKVMELDAEIAGSRTLLVEFERDGRAMQRELPLVRK